MADRVGSSWEREDLSGFYDDPDRFLEPRVRAACRYMEQAGYGEAMVSWCGTVAHRLAIYMPSLREYRP